MKSYIKKTVSNTDSGNFGWGILGFFFPIVGLILFLIWKDEKPLTSKAAGMGALIGFISSIVLLVITTIIAVTTYSAYFNTLI